MRRILLIAMLMFGSFNVIADPYDDVMNKPGLTYKDFKLLYHSDKKEHQVFAETYFRGIIQGIQWYESTLLVEGKQQLTCVPREDYFKMLSVDYAMEMIDSSIDGDSSMERMYLANLYIKVLQYIYPCNKG